MRQLPRFLLAATTALAISACGDTRLNGQIAGIAGPGDGSSGSTSGSTGGSSGGSGGATTSITVSPSSAAMTVGTTENFSAVMRNSSGTSIPATFIWSSSNVSVISVNGSSGNATAVGAGTATITASSGGVSGSASVTVSR